MSRAKKPSFYKKKADALWSRIIRSRGRCEWCGTESKQLNAHHIRGRRYGNTRHLPTNGLCLCVSCHYRAHQDTPAYTEFLLNHIGQEELDRLRREAEKITKVDYKAVLERLELWEK